MSIGSEVARRYRDDPVFMRRVQKAVDLTWQEVGTFRRDERWTAAVAAGAALIQAENGES